MLRANPSNKSGVTLGGGIDTSLTCICEECHRAPSRYFGFGKWLCMTCLQTLRAVSYE